ncbi:MAG TPA: phosphoglycerate kinase [Chloroflexota bacterium]
MAKKTIRDIDLAGKRVLVRVDYNVPLDHGRVADSTRIRETVPTIQYLRETNCKIVLVSHLGRPDGKPAPTLSLKPIAGELEKLLGAPVAFATDIVGPSAQAAVRAMQAGQVLLLENVRFDAREEANDPGFARELAQFGDVYVNDAFATAHRAHASTAGLAAYLPAVAGLLMEKELEHLGAILENPKRPLVAVIGGAKVSSKIGVLLNLLPRLDRLMIGGGMACTFFRAKGLEIGKSLLEEEHVGLAHQIMEEAGPRLDLPIEVLTAYKIDEESVTHMVDMYRISSEMAVADIGPRSVQRFAEGFATAGTILWNGPMGVFEIPRFAKGTAGVAQAVAASPAISVIGGGDTVAAIEKYSDPSKFTHISTGGGASLEFLEGKTLPGVAALQDR